MEGISPHLEAVLRRTSRAWRREGFGSGEASLFFFPFLSFFFFKHADIAHSSIVSNFFETS